MYYLQNSTLGSKSNYRYPINLEFPLDRFCSIKLNLRYQNHSGYNLLTPSFIDFLGLNSSQYILSCSLKNIANILIKEDQYLDNELILDILINQWWSINNPQFSEDTYYKSMYSYVRFKKIN